MPTAGPLHLAIVSDPPQPSAALLPRLSPAERAEARRRTGTAQRHFVLGRLAAHAAIRRVLRATAHHAPAEVVTGPAGEPQVRGDGTPYCLSVSISHVGRMAAACAWRSASDYAAGIDLERVRRTEVAQSGYAFSARERALLAHVTQGPVLAGLAAWAVKEAVWKALWPHQPPSPAAVQIRTLSLAPPRAAANVECRYLTHGASTPIRVRLGNIVGADGEYVLAVAEVGRWGSEAPPISRPIDRRHAPIDNLEVIDDPATVYAEVLDL